MPDWDPVNPDSEWAPADDPAAKVAEGSITNAKLAGDIDPRKITGFGMKVCLSATQAAVPINTETAVEYDTEVFTHNFDPIVSNQIQVPYDGVYQITVGVDWSGGAGDVDDERSWINVNSIAIQGNASPNLTGVRQRYTMAATALLVAGDLVGFSVKHGSAGTRALGSDDPEANNLTVVFLFSI